MIGKPTIRKTTIIALLMGLTSYGGLGTAPEACADSELSGYVFADLDIDSVRDPFEAGIADVVIELTMPSDPKFLKTAHSDKNGHYKFIELEPGIYTITQPTFPLGVRNTSIHVGELYDLLITDDPLSSDSGTAMLLDQAHGILPHVEGIELPDGAQGADYSFGQIYLGKAWLTTDPPPIVPEGVPEPSTGLLLAIGGLLLGTTGRCGSRG